MATQVEIDDWIVKRDKSLRIAQKIKGLLAKAKEENAPQAQIDELQTDLETSLTTAGDFQRLIDGATKKQPTEAEKTDQAAGQTVPQTPAQPVQGQNLSQDDNQQIGRAHV